MEKRRDKRKLSAVLAADVVGYSSLMASDESGTLSALRAHRSDVFDPLISEHGGRIVKLIGDGTLVEFVSVVDAVEAALAIQRVMAKDTSPIVLRIGVNLGDVIVEGDDIYGDGVNIAARLEGLAEPGGICISSIVHESLGNRGSAVFADAGEFEVKNITRPVRVYRWPDHSRGTRLPDTKIPDELKRGQTISVTPFEHLSGDPELAYFCEGMTQDIVTAFGSIEQLTVVSGDDGGNPNVEGADYLLSGSVRQAGNRIRISAKLTERPTGIQVWADRFDRQGNDLFAVQDDVARNIVIAVHTVLGTGSYTNRWQHGTEDFEAWKTFARGFSEFQKFSPDSLAKAVDLFERALRSDPDYTAPLMASAYCYAHLSWIEQGEKRSDLVALAEAAFARSVAAAPDDVRPYASLRAIEFAKGNYAAGVAAARTALDMAPNDSYTRATLAFALMSADQPEEALVQIARAERDMPSTPGWLEMARIESLFMTGDSVKAIAAARETISRLPDFYPAPPLAAALATELDLSNEAETMCQLTLDLDPQFSARQFVAWQGVSNKAHCDRLFAALRQAGLPE